MLRPWGVGFRFPPESQDPGAPRTPATPQVWPPCHTHVCLLHSPLAGCTSGVQPAPSQWSPRMGLDVGPPGSSWLPEICYPAASTHTRQMLDSSWDAAPGDLDSPTPWAVCPCTLSHQPKVTQASQLPRAPSPSI